MAGAARIGSLHVMLGLDSAEFTAGMAKANSGLAKFSKAAKIGFAVVATAAAAAGVALAAAVFGTTKNMAALAAEAKTAGVAFEEFQRLKYAAEANQVSVQALTDGLKELNLRADEFVKTGGGSAAEAFERLGYSADDLKQKLADPSALFSEIIARLSELDTAAQIRIADEIFGGTGGEQFVRFLDGGADGLAALKNEANALGLVMSNSSAKGAQEFTKSITRLQAGLQGMVNRIAEAALPTLNNLINTLTSPDFMQAMQDFAIAAIAIADGIAQVFIGAHKAFKDFMDYIGGPAGTKAVMPEGAGLKDIFPAEYGAAEGDIMRQLEWRMQRGGGGGQNLYEGFGLNSDGTIKLQETTGVVDQLRAAFETLGSGAGSAKTGVDALKQAMTDGQAVFTATRTPAETYKLEIERLNSLLQQGAIDQDTYNRAVMQAQDALSSAKVSATETFDAFAEIKTVVGGVGSALANAFTSGENASDAFFKTVMNGLSNLTGKLADMAVNGLFDMLTGAFSGGLGGGVGGGPVRLGYNLPGFANGTNFAPGGLAMVGERGPELVNLPRGSQVIPNSDLMAGGASRVLVELGPDLEGRILTQSAGQSVQIVRASEPSTVQKSTAASGKALAGGDYRRGMATYGLQQQAKRR